MNDEKSLKQQIQDYIKKKKQIDEDIVFQLDKEIEAKVKNEIEL